MRHKATGCSARIQDSSRRSWMKRSKTLGESSIQLKTVHGWATTIGGGTRSGWVSIRRNSRMSLVFGILSGDWGWSLLLWSPVLPSEQSGGFSLKPLNRMCVFFTSLDLDQWSSTWRIVNKCNIIWDSTNFGFLSVGCVVFATRLSKRRVLEFEAPPPHSVDYWSIWTGEIETGLLNFNRQGHVYLVLVASSQSFGINRGRARAAA